MGRPKGGQHQGRRPQLAEVAPDEPTSAHWYDAERFDRLIAATIAHDEDQGRETLVRQFIAGFRV